MAMRLTFEQEERIAAVEVAVSAPLFEGSNEELEALLLPGLSTKELSEDEFWSSLRRETDKLAASVRRA